MRSSDDGEGLRTERWTSRADAIEAIRRKELFRRSKVAEFEAPLWRQEDVVSFEVSVDHSPFSEIADRRDELGEVQSAQPEGETVGLLDMEMESTSKDRLKIQIKRLLILGSVDIAHDVGVLQRGGQHEERVEEYWEPIKIARSLFLEESCRHSFRRWPWLDYILCKLFIWRSELEMR